ncbi:MAG: hypothetical protein MJY93_07290 [Fibrobacter sp.]|nr:hypothetical protein [Fibrobacter sp.]
MNKEFHGLCGTEESLRLASFSAPQLQKPLHELAEDRGRRPEDRESHKDFHQGKAILFHS